MSNPNTNSSTTTMTSGVGVAVSTYNVAGAVTTDAEWLARAKRAEAKLEEIFGPEAVFEWRTEGIPLAEVRVDPPGTITFNARVDGANVARGKEQSMMVVKLISRLRGAPISDLADLTEPGVGDMTVKVMPKAIQMGLPLPEQDELVLEPDQDEEGEKGEEGEEEPVARMKAEDQPAPATNNRKPRPGGQA